MILRKQTIEELQDILKIEFGRDVDFKTASTMARDLIGYFDTLAKVAHKDKAISKNLSSCSGSGVGYSLALRGSLKKVAEPEPEER